MKTEPRFTLRSHPLVPLEEPQSDWLAMAMLACLLSGLLPGFIAGFVVGRL